MLTGKHRKRHEAKEVNEKPFKCSHCPKSFSFRDYLSRHEKIHRKDNLFKCKKCDREFTTKDYLAKHWKRHSTEKKFMCDKCGQRFAMREDLTKHIRRHEKNREKCIKARKKHREGARQSSLADGVRSRRSERVINSRKINA